MDIKVKQIEQTPKCINFMDTYSGDIFCKVEDYKAVLAGATHKLYLALMGKFKKATATSAKCAVFEAVNLYDGSLVSLPAHAKVYVFDKYECTIFPTA